MRLRGSDPSFLRGGGGRRGLLSPPSLPFMGAASGAVAGIAVLWAASLPFAAVRPVQVPDQVPACTDGEVLSQVSSLAGRLMHRSAVLDGAPDDLGMESDRRRCRVGLRMNDDGSHRVADYRLYLLKGMKGPLAGRMAISLAVEGFQAPPAIHPPKAGEAPVGPRLRAP